MCGIAGILNRQGAPVDLQVLEQMTRILRHRGPDDEGHVLIEMATRTYFGVEGHAQRGAAQVYDLGLGNRRLNIIDLSAASHQPMCNEDGTVWITYNGEIYNYVELALELRARGHVFKSSSDTEVVLHAYEEYGTDCVAHFNGMWAFALWDGDRQILFCSRDRFGEKPFYYFSDDRTFVFASEIKALLQHPLVGRAPNYRTIFQYVANGFGFADLSEETFFAGILQLPAAHSMVVGKSGVRIWRYWTLMDVDVSPTVSEAESIERFGQLFQDSVRLRLRSDVPVGFCLSGGLDSSSIVCMASTLDGPVTTFSSCAEDSHFDERVYIEPVLKQTRAVFHYVFPEGKQLFDTLPKMIWHQDEPWSNLHIYAHWRLMECAHQQGIPVLLNGHGGDETLVGYYPYFHLFHADLLKDLRLAAFIREFRAYHHLHGASIPDELRRLLRALCSYYLRRFHVGEIVGRRRYPHLDPDFVVQYSTITPPKRVYASLLKNELLTGIELSPIPAWLRYEDRNSMAFSVETRQPFLDHRLVEFLFAVPDDLKIRDGVNKFILRQALRDVLPHETLKRTLKIGFKTPAEVWFREDLRGPVWEILTSSSFKSRGIFNVPEVKRAFNAHCSGVADRTAAIWSWVNLELWFKRFFG